MLPPIPLLLHFSHSFSVDNAIFQFFPYACPCFGDKAVFWLTDGKNFEGGGANEVAHCIFKQ